MKTVNYLYHSYFKSWFWKTSVVLFTGLFMNTASCKPGMVVILNGPSASGKSSVQSAMLKESPDHFIKIGIDTFFDALIDEPDLSRFQEEKRFDQHTPSGEYIRGIELTQDENGHQVVPLKIGPAGDRIIHGMHRAIAAYAQAGNNITVDYILYKTAWLPDLFEALKDCPTYFIGFTTPLDVIEEREKKRNTSPIGHARSHYDTVHEGLTYDLEVDSTSKTPEEIAGEILSFIHDNPRG